jgi:glutamate synthase (NADPH/NADH) small chain
MNTLVGRSISLAQLREEHDAVFMGTGAGLPRMLDVEGEHLKGVYTANEFLTRVNLMRADLFPNHTTPVTVGRRVVVVGCGDTAMDASRTSLRLGPDSVDIVYRRTRKESTARDEEVEHAEQEGIVFNWLQTPVRILGNAEGWVTGVECAVMEVTEPGADGRRGVRMTEARKVIPCDTVITALGFGVNPLLPSTEARLETKKGGVVVANLDTGETTMQGVFAGGDVITGGATVILAMGQGRTAAAAMHAQMMGLPMPAAPAPVHTGPVVH